MTKPVHLTIHELAEELSERAGSSPLELADSILMAIWRGDLDGCMHIGEDKLDSAHLVFAAQRFGLQKDDPLQVPEPLERVDLASRSLRDYPTSNIPGSPKASLYFRNAYIDRLKIRRSAVIKWLSASKVKESGIHAFRRPRERPVRDRTVRAIHEIWPTGGIEVETAEERQRKIEAWCEERGFVKPSRRTVNRAMSKVRAN